MGRPPLNVRPITIRLSDKAIGALSPWSGSRSDDLAPRSARAPLGPARRARKEQRCPAVLRNAVENLSDKSFAR